VHLGGINIRINSTTLAGTTVLAALVVVFDYTVKYSNLKIPFPWVPTLKFDFTGIPIALSLLLFGLIPGVFTSVIAFVAIMARSGNFISSSMKALAELATMLGMAAGLKVAKKFRLAFTFSIGVAMRVLIMLFFNLFLFPVEMALPIGVFNIFQGTITIFGGYSIYEAIKRRVPSIIKK
jgi:riboflavin transporter FmnP